MLTVIGRILTNNKKRRGAQASTWIAATTPGLPASEYESAAERRDLSEGRAGPARCQEAVGRGADRLLAQRLQEARMVHGEGGRVVDFSDVVIIVRRLIREGWIRYRWESRPSQRL
jgi:hypothetical protein